MGRTAGETLVAERRDTGGCSLENELEGPELGRQVAATREPEDRDRALRERARGPQPNEQGAAVVVIHVHDGDVRLPGVKDRLGVVTQGGDGYGAAQAVPGPLFTFAAYLGTVMEPHPNGALGGLLALLVIQMFPQLLAFVAIFLLLFAMVGLLVAGDVLRGASDLLATSSGTAARGAQVPVALVPLTQGSMNMVLVCMPSLLSVLTLSAAIHVATSDRSRPPPISRANSGRPYSSAHVGYMPPHSISQ